MKLYLTLLFIQLQIVQVSLASTFVGNGGSAGDLELKVTTMQIHRALNTIKQNEFEKGELCYCPEELERSKSCETLNQLSSDQKKYCEKFLIENVDLLIEMTSSKSSVQFSWTHEKMSVMENHHPRAVEGIASPQNQTIYLNKESFVQLKSFERVYLLGHEYGHFLKNPKGQFISDADQFAPFQQVEGGRYLLNALGAAISLQAYRQGVYYEFQDSLSRSKNYKDHWVTLNFGGDSGHKDESTFNIDSYSSKNLLYQYQFIDSYMLGFGFSEKRGQQKFLDTVTAMHQIQSYSLSLLRRIYFDSNPLSYWGQAYSTIGLGYGQSHGKFKLTEEGYPSIEESSQSRNPFVQLQLYLPFQSGIWFHSDLVLKESQLNYSKIIFKEKGINTQFGLGVGYAF